MDIVGSVWVSDFASVLGLAKALRMWLIGAAREKMVSANQNTAADVIYRYVTGPDGHRKLRMKNGE